MLVATLTLIFSIMTSYARARAESLIDKCKVGFMERPERIVLFMIGAFTDRMAGVLWVILVLVDRDRREPDLLHVSGAQRTADAVDTAGRRAGSGAPSSGATSARRSPYDLWVIAILAFVWLMPPDWLQRSDGHGMGSLGYRCCGADSRRQTGFLRLRAALEAFRFYARRPFVFSRLWS